MQTINEFCAAFSTQVLTKHRHLQMGVPNGLWLSKHMSAMPPFAEACKVWYSGSLRTCDFSEATKTSAAINTWAERETHRLITGIEIPFGAGTDLLVTSSVYLKALWKTPFDTTHKGIFQTAAQARVDVDMMSVNETFRVSRSPDFHAIQVPFRDPNLFMIIALPAPHVSFEQMFFPHSRIFNNANYETLPVHLELPRLDIYRKYDLKAWLMAAGLTNIFVQTGESDLTKLAFPKLVIDAAGHDARLKIDQLGTEAAGVTAIASSWAAGRVPRNQLIINRPFFFSVVDSLFNQILYMGVIANPSHTSHTTT